ncbi:MAG: hypothetical protein DCC49_11985 [Acidobacteria bacterium]|nr:MAG: hypothetical protein DCC49_11985 [Acidobacteriota bacterium]
MTGGDLTDSEEVPINKVLLFASLREAAGSGAVKIAASNLQELVNKACEEFGVEFAAVCERAVAAIDGETIPRSEWHSTLLTGAEEIALLPPVSGGSDYAPETGERISAAVLTVSDRGFRGETEDTSGPAIVELLESEGFEVIATDVVPDDESQIAEKIRGWADFQTARLIVTTGGTGLGPRDVTPEATRAVLEKEAVGLGELMRRSSDNPRSALSRQTAGVRNGCLVINLPGSRAAAIECLVAVVGLVDHAIHAAGGAGHEAPSR